MFDCKMYMVIYKIYMFPTRLDTVIYDKTYRLIAKQDRHEGERHTPWRLCKVNASTN